MSDSLSKRAEEIFVEASELSATDRDAYLDRACANEPALRKEVDALLAASAESAEYFAKLPEKLGIAEVLVEGTGDRGLNSRIVGKPGQQFGQYTLTEPVGSGGMGTVWRAERSDGRFEGDVAVKLLGRSASGASLKRFGLEGRYLAKLSHPNIARLLDAGVDPKDRPYLVLEYVEGVPIDSYCDDNILEVEQRIRLFLQVLEAVAHAHAHLIVHRDIKPSNVLVTADGQVRLLDFGVAKLLTDEQLFGHSALTQEIGAALTPEFAAPEQLDGEQITIATDVYSLGLLLWLLLTGNNPRNVSEMRSLAELRAAANREPTKMLDAITNVPVPGEFVRIAKRRNASASELFKTLRSDLDNIVRKALAVEPAERYSTVADFASDLRRYLRHEPVTAQPQTIRYRARKFVRRHRGGVLTASLTVLALIAAAVITTWQSIEARQQRDLAVYQQQRVQASNEFYGLLLEEIGPDGESLTPVQLLDRGVTLLDQQYGSEDRFVGRILLDVSRRYAGLGEHDRELELLARAETIARSREDHELLAATLCATAESVLISDLDLARRHAEEARQALGRVNNPSIDELVRCLRSEARLVEIDGDRLAAIDLLLDAKRRLAASPTATAHVNGLLLNELGYMYFKERRLGEALAMMEELLTVQQAAGRGNTLTYLLLFSNYATVLGSVGELSAQTGIWEKVIERLQQSGLEKRAPKTFAARYGDALIRVAQFDEALDLLTRGREKATDSGDQVTVAMSDLSIAKIFAARGQFDDAEVRLSAAEEVLTENPGAYDRQFQSIQLTRAVISRGRGDLDQSREYVDAIFRKFGYPATKAAQGLMYALGVAAETELVAGNFSLAEQMAIDRLHLAESVARQSTSSGDVGQTLLLRAKARIALGELEGATNDLTRALPSLANGLGEDHPDAFEAQQLLDQLTL